MNPILSATAPPVTVELLGLARHRAGRAEVVVAGRTVAELLRAVGVTCPGLADVVRDDGTIARQYLVSVDGVRFVADAAEAMPAGQRLLILGADPGG
jgi:molybdopterin converting factor small subunit